MNRREPLLVWRPPLGSDKATGLRGEDVGGLDDVGFDASGHSDDLTHSTPAARDRTVAARLLSGEDKSIAKLSIRGADGAVRDVTVPRSRTFSASCARRPSLKPNEQS